MSLKKFVFASAAFALFAAANSPTEAAKQCPTQNYSGPCIQVITWAKNPDTGTCCQYPNPCVVPAGWQTYNSPDCINQVIEL